MKKYWIALFLSLFMANIGIADTNTLKPYQAGDWSSLVKTANGAPLAVHFWGVTCPACVKEMPQWGSSVSYTHLTLPTKRIV